MFDIINLQKYLAKDLLLINECLNEITSKTNGLTSDVFSHIIKNGKRIRPMLLILTAKMLESRVNENIINAAAAVELIHAASLLHDDVIDKTLLRRNKKTANAIWGDKEAILVGDNIFTESFLLMLKTKNFDAINTLVNASHLLTKGEIIQLEKRFSIPSIAEYEQVIYYKTAALFEASTELASIYTNHDNGNIKDLGRNIGMAFQIVDDIMDYTSQESGKEVGTDFFEYKATLPTILLANNVHGKEKAINHFIHRKESNLDEMISIMQNEGIFEESRKHAKKYVENAFDIVNSYPKNEASSMLTKLLETFHLRIV